MSNRLLRFPLFANGLLLSLLFYQLKHLAFYLTDLCLVEYEALKFKPSLLCASAIYVARSTLKMTEPWTPLLRRHARYDEPQLR